MTGSVPSDLTTYWLRLLRASQCPINRYEPNSFHLFVIFDDEKTFPHRRIRDDLQGVLFVD